MKKLRGSTKYQFDAVLAEDASEKAAKIFANTVTPLLDHFIAGGHSAFISYGQKGLGKSEFLSSRDGGLITEILRYLFEIKELDALEMAIQFVAKSSVVSIKPDPRSSRAKKPEYDYSVFRRLPQLQTNRGQN